MTSFTYIAAMHMHAASYIVTIKQGIFEGYKFSWLKYNPRKLIASILVYILGVRMVQSMNILIHRNYRFKAISEIHKIL